MDKNKINTIQLYKLFTIVLLFCVFVNISINIIVDPRGIFRTEIFPVVVSTARSSKLKMIEAQEEIPKVIVLGSSVAMRYSPFTIKNKLNMPTFNLSVNSGKTEDFLVMMKYLVEELNIIPKVAIIAINPRSLTDKEKIDNRLVGNWSLFSLLNINPIKKSILYGQTVLNTLNIYYLKDVIKSLIHATDLNNKKMYDYSSDGFLSRDIIKDDIGRWKSSNYPYYNYSTERLIWLDELIAFSAEHLIKLIFVLPPNSPSYINSVNANGTYTKEYLRLNNLLKQKVNGQNASVYLLSEIENYSGVDEFEGGDHPSIHNSDLIINFILKDINVTNQFGN